MHEGRDGGLDDPLDPYAGAGDEETLMCFLTLDGEGTIVSTTLAKSHPTQQRIEELAKANGADAILWGEARGYASGKLGVIYFPCTVRAGASEEVHRSLRASMTTSGPEDSRERRDTIMSLLADVTRYAAEHSAKCRNADVLRDSAPVLQ